MQRWAQEPTKWRPNATANFVLGGAGRRLAAIAFARFLDVLDTCPAAAPKWLLIVVLLPAARRVRPVGDPRCQRGGSDKNHEGDQHAARSVIPLGVAPQWDGNGGSNRNHDDSPHGVPRPCRYRHAAMVAQALGDAKLNDIKPSARGPYQLAFRVALIAGHQCAVFRRRGCGEASATGGRE
jgi:hypothetical protein